MSSLASSNQFDQRHTDLLKASSKGDEKQVFNLIDGELWNSQTDKDALRQSLQRVAGRGNLKLAEYLLAQKAEVNVSRDNEISALYQAARAGHSKIVDLLLKHEADTEFRDKDGRSALWTPVMRGFTETVKLLLDGGANVNAKDKEGKNILIHIAAEKPGRWMQDKKLEIVHMLLSKGANVEALDKTRRTALSWAASSGKAELCEVLLSGKSGKKADIRAHNSKQQTALHWACENNHDAAVKVLLDHGADPAARSDGRWTPLHMAAQRGHSKVVRLLLEQGEKTPVNAQLTNGMTALHWAAFNGHEAVVELLLRRSDTRLSLKDTYDRTAVLCAAENKHRDIVTKLSPGMTGERLPEAEKEASKNFQATVVDFGEFRDGKKQLVFKDYSVYELLHGWDHEKSKPIVATQVKNIRHQPSFRWIHLPANNIAWVETLLAKAFIEGGHKDIEDFKAVEKCFNQEHRGGEAHAHFMRPWSQRYAISPRRMEKAPDSPIDPPNNPPDRVDAALEKSGATLVVTPPEDEPPSTPGAKRPPPSPTGIEHPGSGRRKQKKPKETMEDRHGKTAKRRNGPPGDAQAKKQKAPDKAPSGAPKEAPKAPGANGKIVLFMPYLHYECDSKRRKLAQAIQRARDPHDDDAPEKHCADDMLIQAYLNHEPPLHIRRTLDQFFYHSIDTTARDADQVVYRHFKQKLKSQEPMIFMVDQLWLWILGKELIVTSFPQRWDLPTNEDPLNVLLGIIEDMNAKTRPPVESVYDLAMLITGRCCGMFDRHRLENESYQFLDMFEIAIGKITDRETRLFERFKMASAATSLYLVDNANSTREARRYPEGRPGTEAATRAEYTKDLVDISIETQLLAEIKDIQDELAILNMVLQMQSNVLPDAADNIMRELGGKKSHAATDVERKMKEQIKLIQVHMKDIERMRRQTQGIYISLTNLLDLKQKHANAFEARFASNQAAITARQGQTVLLFTIVTILFLPMSFIAAFFAINVHDWDDLDGGKGLSLSYVSKYMFSIGLGISLPLIFVAFFFEDIAVSLRKKMRFIRSLGRRRNGERESAKEGRQMSDLDRKVQAILDVPRASLAADKVKEEKIRKSFDVSTSAVAGNDAKHLGWEDANGEKAGMCSRARRESRASRGSNWSRPRVSFDRRRRGSDDLERGAAVVENGGTH